MSNRSSQFDRNSHHNPLIEHGVEEVSFGKTVQSSAERGKENNSMLSNNTNNSMMTENKSKSYVNAMIALQKKVKTL